MDTGQARTGQAARQPASWLGLLADRHVILALAVAAFAGLVMLKVPRLAMPQASLGTADFRVAALDGLKRPNGVPVPGFSRRDVTGGVSVLNVWGSWCGYCRAEHGALMELASQRKVKLLGLAVKDEPSSARAYLVENGIPYDAVGVDEDGQVPRLLGGVSGVPTTLVLDRNGRVVTRISGGLSRERIARELMPAVDKAWTIPAQKQS